VLGIGGQEFFALAVIALLVLGPEKLPRYAADAARWLRQARALIARARAEVADQLGPEFADVSLKDLNPRTFVTRQLFDGDPDPLGLRDPDPLGLQADPPAPGGRQRVARHVPGQTPPYDSDAT
jgi:sec-independent protein translocase protein TatB